MQNKLFCYLVDFGSVSNGDIITKDMLFDSDSDFTIKHIRTNLSNTTEAQLTISKAGGEQMSNSAFELRALAGTNNALNIFEDVVIPRASKLTFSANVSAGASQPLQIQFWGIKN